MGSYGVELAFWKGPKCRKIRGSKADICSAKGSSALPPKADMCNALVHVCYGPKADIDGLFDHLVGSGE